METRNRVIVRAWRPCMQTIEVSQLDDPDLKENMTFSIGHISFEKDGDYRSLWSIEYVPKYTSKLYKEKYNEEAYRNHFENLLAQYGEAPLYSNNRYDYKKQNASVILQYEMELEKRESDVLLCFYHASFGLREQFNMFAMRVNGFHKSCQDGNPGNLHMRGWLYFGNGLLINRGFGGQSIFSAAMEILARDDDLFNKKGVHETPYGLHDQATFDDFLKVLTQMKRDELKAHPELKEAIYIHPGETLLMAEVKRSCVLL